MRSKMRERYGGRVGEWRGLGLLPGRPSAACARRCAARGPAPPAAASPPCAAAALPPSPLLSFSPSLPPSLPPLPPLLSLPPSLPPLLSLSLPPSLLRPLTRSLALPSPPPLTTDTHRRRRPKGRNRSDVQYKMGCGVQLAWVFQLKWPFSLCLRMAARRIEARKPVSARELLVIEKPRPVTATGRLRGTARRARPAPCPPCRAAAPQNLPPPPK